MGLVGRSQMRRPIVCRCGLFWWWRSCRRPRSGSASSWQGTLRSSTAWGPQSNPYTVAGELKVPKGVDADPSARHDRSVPGRTPGSSSTAGCWPRARRPIRSGSRGPPTRTTGWACNSTRRWRTTGFATPCSNTPARTTAWSACRSHACCWSTSTSTTATAGASGP